MRRLRVDHLKWPDRVYHPLRGWPIWIPPTTETKYLSGYNALNLPALPDEPRLGDWHENGAWWSPTYLRGDGEPDIAELWGPDGSREGAPGPRELHDARPALAELEHPAARGANPVLCATVAQAILDLAWHEITCGRSGPGRREVIGWTDEATEQHVRRLAIAREPAIEHQADLAKWRTWQATSLAGNDRFYTARPHLANPSSPPPAPSFLVKTRRWNP